MPKQPSPLLSRQEVLHLAELSRLALTDDEVERLGPQLSDIVAYVELLAKVDTEGVEPLIHPYASDSPVRADVVAEGVGQDGIAQASKIMQDQVVVPRIIE